MDRLEAMSIFVTAVDTGSLSAAGRKLRIPLPTVSRKLSDLETHLNTRLLQRSTRRLSLTDAGMAYLAASRRILEEVRSAEQVAAGEYATLRGELTVSAPVVFGRLHVLPVVADFLAANPAVQVRLLLADRNAHLVDDRVDVAVRIGRLADSTLVARRVGTVRRVVCGSPSYLDTVEEPKTPAELTRVSCVTSDFLDRPAMWSFADPGTDASMAIPIQPRLSVNTAEAAVDAAIAGVGVTQVLSYQAAAAIAQGQLRIILQRFENAPVPVSVMHVGGERVALKTRAFLDHAARSLKQRLGQLASLAEAIPD